MSRTTLNRIGLALILAAVLSLAPEASWAARHPQPTAPARPAAASLLAQSWSHLVRIWARVGSAIDPNGLWVPVGNTVTSSTNTDPRNLN